MSNNMRRDASSEAVEPGVAFLNPRFREERLPWRQIFGYAGSVVMTLAALFLVVRHPIAPALLLAAVLSLAVVQAGLQLAVFMHLREGRGPAWHVTLLGLAFFTAIAMVGATIWIMAFKWGVS